MKTALIVIVFVLVTLGPLLALCLRAATGKRRDPKSGQAGKE